MKQSKFMSLIEAVVSIMVGFGISVVAQIFVLPLLGVTISFSQNLTFALIMTAISIARQFVMRRVFEALHIRRQLSPFMTAAIEERFRQIEKEGWSADHDDRHHVEGDLALAGAFYARYAGATVTNDVPSGWPWGERWWKPAGFRRDLVKACALIIAEGEKHDRNRKQGRAR